MKKLMTALAVIAVAAASQAALIAYEGFNYTAGESLNGKTGTWPVTNGWFASATATTIASSGLTYGTLPVTGNALAVTNNNTVYSRKIGNSTLVNQTTWFSILVNPAASGALQRFMVGTYQVNTSGSASSSYGVGFTIDGVNLTSRASANSGTLTTTGSGAGLITTESVNFIIGRLTLTSAGAGSESMDLWVNPANYTSEGALGTANINVVGDFRMGWDYTTNPSEVAIGFQGTQSGTRYTVFDEMRLGNSLSDVLTVPEPATFALFGLAGGSILMYRRSRKSASEDQE
jgi:hypothetical protein